MTIIDGLATELKDQARTRFASFIKERINPTAADRDLHHTQLPMMYLREAAEMGMVAFGCRVEAGGEGRDMLEWGLMLETVGYECEDIGLPILLGTSALCANALCEVGRDDLIQRYAAPMARGERFGCVAHSDGGERSDVFHFQTVAKQKGGSWYLNGVKKLVTGGTLPAASFIAFASDASSGYPLGFLVQPDDPGVGVERLLCAGVRSAGFAQVTLMDVKLDASRLVFERDALSVLQALTSRINLMWACVLVGRMQAIYERGVMAMTKRFRYGQSIADFPHVQGRMGRAFAGVETSRATTYRALDAFRRTDHCELWDPLATIARWHATEKAVELTMALQRILGGEAYLTETRPWERDLRDVLAMIAAGHDILEVDLGAHSISHFAHKQGLELSENGGR